MYHRLVDGLLDATKSLPPLWGDVPKNPAPAAWGECPTELAGKHEEGAISEPRTLEQADGDFAKVMRLVAARSSSCSSWIIRSDLMGLDGDGVVFLDDHAIVGAVSALPMKAANETFFGFGPPEECTLPSVCFELEHDGAWRSRSLSEFSAVEVRPLSPNHFERGENGVSSLVGPPQAGLLGAGLSS